MKLLLVGDSPREVPGHELVESLDERPMAALFSLASDTSDELTRLEDFCRRHPELPVLALAPELKGAALIGLRARVRKAGAQEAVVPADLEDLSRVLDFALERHKLAQELDTWRNHEDITEAANRRATQVLALVSHEIRGRMTVINFMSTLANDPRTKEERRQECLRVLKESSESLQSLLNDLLDYSKLLEGELSLSPTDFALRNLLENTVSGFRILAESKGLEVKVEVEPSVPDSLVGDPGRLRQVLVNLVGNALKFTHHGSVTVSVHPEGEREGKLGLRFAVTDTGIGIPEHLQDRVFKPYSQAESSTSRKYGGTGLGLSIASKIAELMGGKLALTSQPGQGTSFYFTGWLEQRHLEEVAAPSAVSLKDLRVLIADGNPVSRGMTEKMLAKAGVEAMVAPTAQATLALLRAATRENAPVELALLDVVMPDADGFHLAEEIKADPELSGTRLILLTSAGQRGDAARCLDLGVSGYLSRPLETEDLLDAARLVMVAERGLVTRHTVREARQ